MANAVYLISKEDYDDTSKNRTNVFRLPLPFSEEEMKELQKTIKEPRVSDYETCFEDYEIDDNPDFNELNKFFKRVDKLSKVEIDHIETIYRARKDYYSFQTTYDDAIDILEKGAYIIYPCKDIERVTEILVDEEFFGVISDTLREYLDYELLSKQLLNDGYIECSTGDVIKFLD
ncbi:MAG: hypothetical protein EOL97_15765 [Spirochaetia bacterium]|nr:hypothetical protein [Spirochaetia bacterium]